MSVNAQAQPFVDIPLVISDNTGSRALNIGIDFSATECIDPLLGEYTLPLPDPGVFDARMDLGPYCYGAPTTYKDYRYLAPSERMLRVDYRLNVQYGQGATGLSINYQIPQGPGDMMSIWMILKYIIGGDTLSSDALLNSGTYNINSPVSSVIFQVDYRLTDVPEPIFSPGYLEFWNIQVNQDSSTLLGRLYNMTNMPLTLLNAQLADSQFTFSSAPFPFELFPGAFFPVTVTYNPLSYGIHTANIIFANNGPYGPLWYTLRGTGADCFQLEVNLNDGWNLVSIPGLLPSNYLNEWWTGRDRTSGVYRFSEGYKPIPYAVPSQGYWVKHSGTRIYNTGDEWPAGGIKVIPHDTILTTNGWNLIGVYECPVPASAVITIPPGSIQGNIYKYSGSYLPADTLYPGYAYWVKTSGTHIIIPDCP